MKNVLQQIAVSLIGFYRKYLSSIKLQSCRFYPTCSEYTLLAVKKYGAGRGCWHGLLRILRCHPFSKGGYDPVR